MNPTDPTPSSIEDDLTAYVDGELSPERMKEVDTALAADPRLRALAERLRQAIAAVEALPAPVADASPRLRRAVLEQIAEPTWKERLARWLTPPRLVPLGLAMAAGVAAVVVLRPGPLGDEGLQLDEEKLLLAQNLDVVEDLEVLGLDRAEDLDVVAELHELEVMR